MTDSNDEEMAKAECPYCGKEFYAETEMEAEIKEGEHRAEEHVQNNEEQKQSKTTKGKNIVDEWRTEGKRA